MKKNNNSEIVGDSIALPCNFAKAVANKSTIALAFVGDAVLTLCTRAELVTKHDLKPAELHKRASAFDCAKAQAQAFDQVLPHLTDVEADIARRARNSETNTVPKSCTLAEYKKATALEAVIGYNYMIGGIERVVELFTLGGQTINVT